MLEKLELKSEHRCYEGWQRYYEHPSEHIGLPMRFSIYLPPQAQALSATEHPDDPRRQGQVPCPVLFFLAGLTCTEETFMIKAAAQRFAAEQGMILVTPDTSPRGARSEEHTSELQSRGHIVCRLLLEKKKDRLISQM